MKIFATLILLVLVLGIGSFAYIAASDVPVTQTTITKDIPGDQINK